MKMKCGDAKCLAQWPARNKLSKFQLLLGLHVQRNLLHICQVLLYPVSCFPLKRQSKQNYACLQIKKPVQRNRVVWLSYIESGGEDRTRHQGPWIPDQCCLIGGQPLSVQIPGVNTEMFLWASLLLMFSLEVPGPKQVIPSPWKLPGDSRRSKLPSVGQAGTCQQVWLLRSA